MLAISGQKVGPKWLTFCEGIHGYLMGNIKQKKLDTFFKIRFFSLHGQRRSVQIVLYR